jgi:CheY-like chemotaxis protein
VKHLRDHTHTSLASVCCSLTAFAYCSTPVTGLLTAASLLERRPSVTADSEAAFLVQTIRSCGSLMLSVVSNVLDMRALDVDADPDATCSRTPRASDRADVRAVRAVALKPAPFSARGLLDEVLGAVCAAMGAPPLAPRVRQEGELPPTVIADVERLTRILQNASISLLRHAPRADALAVRIACPLLAHTDGGADADASGVAELRIDLLDEARHVAEAEDFELMYAPYFTSATPAHGGLHSGLGLCVARGFARAMGGSLIAERTAPAGAEPSGVAMRLRLPVRLPPPPRGAAGQPAQPCGTKEASALPCKTDSALLRQLHRGGGGALGASGSAARTPAAAGDDADARAQTEEHAALRVLLVEDHDLIRKLVSTMLRGAGFVVATAVNGADALAQLQAAAELPDAVLTDIQARARAASCLFCVCVMLCSLFLTLQLTQMPVMDGLGFARAFRAWEAARGAPRLPIVALSANVLDEHVAQSRRHGRALGQAAARGGGAGAARAAAARRGALRMTQPVLHTHSRRHPPAPCSRPRRRISASSARNAAPPPMAATSVTQAHAPSASSKWLGRFMPKKPATAPITPSANDAAPSSSSSVISWLRTASSANVM